MTEIHPIDRLFEVDPVAQGRRSRNLLHREAVRAGPLKIAKKFGEEAVETALAGVAERTKRSCGESADLLYHLLVLWAACGLEPEDDLSRARSRGRTAPAFEEKASRNPD